MTDLHTHILPGMDDGARNVQESLDLLRMEWEQGVHTVVLTPHLYRDRENLSHFLHRRERAVEELEWALDGLPVQARENLPQLILGAEVIPAICCWNCRVHPGMFA